MLILWNIAISEILLAIRDFSDKEIGIHPLHFQTVLRAATYMAKMRIHISVKEAWEHTKWCIFFSSINYYRTLRRNYALWSSTTSQARHLDKWRVYVISLPFMQCFYDIANLIHLYEYKQGHPWSSNRAM